MKKFCFALLVAASFNAVGAEYQATVTSSDCVKISQHNNITSTLIGSSVGSGLGAYAGGRFFGRNGSIVGGLVGATAGGYLAEKHLAESSYRCVVSFNDTKGKTVTTETLGNLYKAGQSVRVIDAGHKVIVL